MTAQSVLPASTPEDAVTSYLAAVARGRHALHVHAGLLAVVGGAIARQLHFAYRLPIVLCHLRGGAGSVLAGLPESGSGEKQRGEHRYERRERFHGPSPKVVAA